MANDPTVKAGSWGPKTVEKILRIQERALRLELPMIYLVDSAGARITDQVQMFPGRRGAGRIFYNEVLLSGRVPQICLLFGPVGRRRRLHPGLLRRRDHARGQRLDVPGLAADGRDGDRREGDARGDGRGEDAHRRLGVRPLPRQERRGSDRARQALPVVHAGSWRETPPAAPPAEPAAERAVAEIVPDDEKTVVRHQGVDRRRSSTRIRSARSTPAGRRSSWSATRGSTAARSGSSPTSPSHKGGVLFVDSADKAARFIATCNAFNIPLLFLADVPGFMIGTDVERQGIIRHGAKMISAVSEATVPKISVIVRKAYGAGLYAMAGPAFDPDCCIALPTALDRRDGARGRDQRCLLQPDPGDRGRGRAPAVREREARAVLGRHRHPPPRLGDGRRCDDRPRLAARPADRALRARRGPRPAVLPRRNPITPA